MSAEYPISVPSQFSEVDYWTTTQMINEINYPWILLFDVPATWTEDGLVYPNKWTDENPNAEGLENLEGRIVACEWMMGDYYTHINPVTFQKLEINTYGGNWDIPFSCCTTWGNYLLALQCNFGKKRVSPHDSFEPEDDFDVLVMKTKTFTKWQIGSTTTNTDNIDRNRLVRVWLIPNTDTNKKKNW